MHQRIMLASDEYKELDVYIQENKFNCILLVCATSLRLLKIKNYFDILEQIADALGCNSAEESVDYFRNLLRSFQFEAPALREDEDLAFMAASVNSTRLKNHPIALDTESLKNLYHQMLNIKKK